MNMLFIKHFVVGFMVSEIPRVSLFGHCPYSVTFPCVCMRTYIYIYICEYVIHTMYVYIIYRVWVYPI